MNIEIKKPELEALIQQQMDSGAFKIVDDLLIEALYALEHRPKRLIDVLRDPRFAGSGLEIERSKDPGRDIDL